MGDAFKLHPTPTRLALLADIAAGKVMDDADFAPHLDLGDEGTARVADAVWEMEGAGWVQQVRMDHVWQLTLLGQDVLQGRVADA